MRKLLSTEAKHPAVGYPVAGVTVVVLTLVISLLRTWWHLADTPVLYFLGIVWLTMSFGRGPAIAAAVLSYIAYDARFSPPQEHLTDWIVLAAMLLVSIEIGRHPPKELRRILALAAQSREKALNQVLKRQQLAIERLAHESRASGDVVKELLWITRDGWERSTILLDLSHWIVSTHDTGPLLQGLVDRVRAAFTDAGVLGCALLLPEDATRSLVTKAVAADSQLVRVPLSMSVAKQAPTTNAYFAAATLCFQRGRPYGIQVDASELDGRHHSSVDEEPLHVMYVPLKKGDRVLGVLGLVGPSSVVGLGYATPSIHFGGPWSEWVRALRGPHADLFAAFCEQISLAIDSVARRQERFAHMEQVQTDLIAHQLLSPVTELKSAAQYLLSAGEHLDPDEHASQLRSFVELSDQMESLTHNLLILGRLSVSPQSLQKGWCNIRDIIEAALASSTIAGEAVDRRIELVPFHVPPVMIDHSLIEEVVKNLVSNALKYSPVTAPISLQVRTLAEPQRLEVSVSDRGIGVPEQELGNIFRRYHTLDLSYAPRDRVGPQWPPRTTGLGLAVCKAIVEAHGGNMLINSVVGEGTTIGFTVPLPEPESEEQLEDPDVAFESVLAAVEGVVLTESGPVP
jgi:K+-sensing histidine kinase KdpD